MPLRIAYIGNFGVSFSTENHVAKALERNGHEVVRMQENVGENWRTMRSWKSGEVDFVLWTRTWNEPSYGADRTVAHLKAQSIPIVGYHLDRWWGLEREQEIGTTPFFTADILCTADGGNQQRWEDAGITHWWFPPAVSLAECEMVGVSRPQFESDVAFVGSWKGYHPAWNYRLEVVEKCRELFGDRFKTWPDNNRDDYRPAIREQELADLYASVRVLVGDSCLVGGIEYYWSDRVPETLGRGGCLIHPSVVGLDEQFTIGTHLLTYELGDFDGLSRAVEDALANPVETAAIAAAGKRHVMDCHTYERRMQDLVKRLYGEKVL